jgi:hypothetical protein
VADASLIVDRRAEAGFGPGLHAVIVGVSDYAHLNDADSPPGEGLKALKKLQSCALSAFRIAEKLRALDAEKRLVRPLKTLRLLIAPSPLELASEPMLTTIGGSVPTCKAIKLALRAWRDDLAASKEDQSLFLFSGHGIRRSLEETILLASDFLDPSETKLENAFRLSSLRNGLVPSDAYPNIGREQFYFIDACRDKPDALDGLEDTDTPKIFDAELGSFDDRRAPIFFSTKTGGSAAGPAGKPTYFTEALLWSLDNGSFNEMPLPGIVDPVWPVTAQSLKAGIEAADKLFENRIELTGLVADPALCFRRDPPHLQFKLSLTPDNMRAKVGKTTLQNINAGTEIELSGDPANAIWAQEIAAGYYKLSVNPAADEFPIVSSKVRFFTIQVKMPLAQILGPN